MADSTLYFIRREADGAIKIGITTNLGRRVPDLQRQHGAMTVLGVVEGAATREKLAHLIFADDRLDGEFFQPSQEVLSFVEQYAAPPPIMRISSEGSRTGNAPRASKNRPWIDLYSDPMATYDRDQFVNDYESWIERGLLASTKRMYLPIFRSFPEKIVFVPQPGLKGWGWTPLNPHCWTDVDGRRLHYG
jgi:hypothetical protein